MKQWSKAIEIHAPIEQVWSYLSGSLEQMQKIMPQVVDNQPIKLTEEVVGSIYRQKYREGKRVEEYDVHTLDYADTPDFKKLKVGFTLANWFEITAMYELRRLDDRQTELSYTVTNRPLKWFVHLFLIFANEKVVTAFLQRTKEVAESGA